MLIENTNVYGLEESVSALKYSFNPNGELGEPTEREWRVAKACGSAKPASGHDCLLKGITVNADITMPHYWWNQFQRYHFADIIMSTSKMHSILKMDFKDLCNEEVDDLIINFINELKLQYDNETNPAIKKQIWRKLLSNSPLGLFLKARITTNYLQLKTMYNQRKTHKLNEWKEFCNWCDKLPRFNELTACTQIKTMKGD